MAPISWAGALALLAALVAPASAAPHPDSGCDASFPLAPPEAGSHGLDRHDRHPRRQLFANPADPTRRTYGPLCISPDGLARLDVRRLQQCPAGQCWVGGNNFGGNLGGGGGCFHSTSQECRTGVLAGTNNNNNGWNGNAWANGNGWNGNGNNGNVNWAANGNDNWNGNNGNNNWNNGDTDGDGVITWGDVNNNNGNWDANGNGNWNPNGNPNNNNWNGNNANDLDGDGVPDRFDSDPNHSGAHSCSVGQCWVAALGGCFHITSLECRHPPPTPRPSPMPVPRPTAKPTFGVVVTSHAVQIVLTNLKKDAALSAEVRAHMIRDVKERLERDLHGELELVNVEFAGFLHRRDDTSASLPLKITVRGRADLNEVALASIMDVVRDLLQDLGMDLKALDYDLFQNVNLDVDTFDFADVASGTPPPTPRPSPRPTPNPIPAPKTVTTSHRVKVTLDGVPRGYALTSVARGTILRTVREIVEEHLENGLELVNVDLAGRLSDRANGRVFLPLRVTLRGPEDVSDFALSVLLDVLDMEGEAIVEALKEAEWSTFKDATVSTGTYAEADVDANPEPVVLEKSEHPIALTVDDVASGYRLDASDKVKLTRFVQELLEDNLHESLELLSVDYAGARRLSRENRRLASLAVPLLVTVKGPADEADRALPHILDALDDHEEDLVRFLQTLDADAFDSATVSAGRFDPSVNANVPIAGLEETEHAVQLIFQNLPPGYRLPSQERGSLIRFVERLLADNLDEALELVDVSYAGTRRALQGHGQRRLDELALPLRVTVKGPPDAQEYALSYIVRVLEAHEEDMMRFLVSLDRNAFQDVVIKFEWDPYFGMEESDHSLRLRLRDVPEGYRLTNRDLSSIVRFVREVLVDNLHPSLELVDVAYGRGGRKLSGQGQRRLGALVLPLVVTVRGPEDEVELALGRIMRAIRDSLREIELYLKSIDGAAFKNAGVELEASDPANHPANQAAIMSEGEGSEGHPWWVWFLVTLAILFVLCLFCVCATWCWKYQQERGEESAGKNIDAYLSGRREEVREDKPRPRPKRRGRRSSREVQDNKPVVIEKPVYIEKPIVVEKPVIVEKPVLMGPSGAMVPYDPNAVPNTTAMVPYAPQAPPPHPAIEAAHPERLALPYYERSNNYMTEPSVDSNSISILTGRGMEPPEESFVPHRPMQMREPPPTATISYATETSPVQVLPPRSSRSSGNRFGGTDPRKSKLKGLPPSREDEPLQLLADPKEDTLRGLYADRNTERRRSSSSGSESSYSTEPPPTDDSYSTPAHRRRSIESLEDGSYAMA